MTKKLTPKQLKFRDLYLELGNATEAYRRSYSCGNMKEATIRKRAGELLRNGAIAGTISEIQSKVAEKFETTIDSLTLELNEAFQVAKGEKMASAMVSAILGKAKLHGFLKDKVEVNNLGPVVPVINVSISADQSQPAPKAGLSISNARH